MQEKEILPRVSDERAASRAALIHNLIEAAEAANFLPTYLVFKSFGIMKRFQFFLEKEGITCNFIHGADIGKVSRPGIYLVIVHPNLTRLRKGLDVMYFFSATDGLFVDYASVLRSRRLSLSTYKNLVEHCSSTCDVSCNQMYTLDCYDDFFRTAQAVRCALAENSNLKLSDIPALHHYDRNISIKMEVDGRRREVYPHSLFVLRGEGRAIIGSGTNQLSEFRLLEDFDDQEWTLFLTGLKEKGWSIELEGKDSTAI